MSSSRFARWVLLATAGLAPAAASAAGRQRVAVLELRAVGLPADKAQALQTTLGSVLTAETARLGHKVISMADIAAMLAFEKQRDLLGCDQASCLAEIGGALGVDLMLSGSVGLVGDTFTVSLTLVDIKKAEVRQRFVGNAGSEAVLAATLTRGVGVLFGDQKDTSGMGAIFVKTNPPSAALQLDGKDIGRSPMTLDEVQAGDHLLVATLGERRAERVVRVEPESVARIELALAESPPVRLMVISEPPEAQVLLNGEPRGVTPLMLSAVPSGAATLRVDLEHYQPYEARLELSYAQYEKSGRQAFRHIAKLSPRPVTLELTGLPEGASVTLDGERREPKGAVLPGAYKLRTVAPGYQALAQDIVIEAGRDQTLPLAMVPTAAQTAYLDALSSRQTLFLSSTISTGCLAAASAALFVFAELARASSERLHDRYVSATDQAEMDQHYQHSEDDMRRARALRTFAFISGGAALVSAGLSTYFRITYPVQPAVELSPTPEGGAGALLLINAEL